MIFHTATVANIIERYLWKCKFWETGEMGKDETAGTCWIRIQISYRNESLKNNKRERKKRKKDDFLVWFEKPPHTK